MREDTHHSISNFFLPGADSYRLWPQNQIRNGGFLSNALLCQTLYFLLATMNEKQKLNLYVIHYKSLSVRNATN